MMWIEKVVEELSQNNKVFAESFGEVQQIQGQIVISKGPVCSVGDICVIGETQTKFEVVALEEQSVHMLPLELGERIRIGDRVYRLEENQITIPHHDELLGWSLNGVAKFLDEEKEELRNKEKEEILVLAKEAPHAMKRKRIDTPVKTGVKAIDSMLTLGEGQRMGIFAGSGVGKSTLLGMLAKQTEVDVNVIALIGERGREVREFIEESLGEEGMRRSVLIVATSDELPLMQIKAAQVATAIAEKFRDDGKRVLLMMDSVTRFMLAVKQVDISIGKFEMGGRTPSMELMTQQLLERAGMGQIGSITGLYTVLVSGDDMNGAIADIARGILDGHMILDRKLAMINHYPAIDVLMSKSRVMEFVTSPEHKESAESALKYLGIYAEYKDMIQFGDYKPGKNSELDAAVYLYPKIQEFLRQGRNNPVSFEEVIEELKGFVV